MPQNPPEPPRRRWLRFSLRTLFVLMLVASLPLAWMGYSLNWIRERHEAFGRNRAAVEDAGNVTAPGGLWLFGEQGWPIVWCRPETGEVEAMRALFSEASVAPLQSQAWEESEDRK